MAHEMKRRKMMRNAEKGRIRVVLMAVFFILISACAGSQTGGSGSVAQADQGKTGSSPLYRDFGDVLLPGELSVENTKTYVFEGPGFLTGIITLKGRVERNSLITFFRNNMAKDNWKAVTSFKVPKRAILLFQKETRWCVINVSEDNYNTIVEVGIAPTRPDDASGLFKSAQ
jgi:hypothetical protein